MTEGALTTVETEGTVSIQAKCVSWAQAFRARPWSFLTTALVALPGSALILAQGLSHAADDWVRGVLSVMLGGAFLAFSVFALLHARHDVLELELTAEHLVLKEKALFPFLSGERTVVERAAVKQIEQLKRGILIRLNGEGASRDFAAREIRVGAFLGPEDAGELEGLLVAWLGW